MIPVLRRAVCMMFLRWVCERAALPRGDALLDGCTDVPEKGGPVGPEMKRMPAYRPALGSQEKLAVLRCDFRSLPQQIATATNIRECAFGCARSVCPSP